MKLGNLRRNKARSYVSLATSLVVLFVFSIPLSARGQTSESVKALRQMGKAFAEIAEKASPAVVSIKAERTVSYDYPSVQQWPFGRPFDPFEDDIFRYFFEPRGRQRNYERPKAHQTAQGSGFIISPDGYILTNNHVIEGADDVTVTLGDNRSFKAKIIGTDPESEVAVIKIDAEHLAYLQLADSDVLEVGEWVLAIGNPFGFSHTVTAGIVSAKGRSNVGLTTFEDYIQTDAAINPGNSGGPLINLDGKVVGINTAIVSRSGGNIGIGLAIPINMAKSIYKQLVESGTVSRGFLGIGIQNLDPGLAKSFGLPEGTKGVLVPEVQEGSAAEKAGLQRGDVIVEFEGRPVNDKNDLMNRVASLKPGTKVDIVVLRNGSRMTIRAELGKRKPSEEVVSTSPEGQAKDLGITVQELTRDLAERFGYEYDSGVIVSSVEPGSEAERNGITPGTLIMQVNQRPVKNKKDFDRAIRDAAKEKSVLLLIKQDRYVRYVVLNFDKQ